MGNQVENKIEKLEKDLSQSNSKNEELVQSHKSEVSQLTTSMTSLKRENEEKRKQMEVRLKEVADGNVREKDELRKMHEMEVSKVVRKCESEADALRKKCEKETKCRSEEMM